MVFLANLPPEIQEWLKEKGRFNMEVLKKNTVEIPFVLESLNFIKWTARYTVTDKDIPLSYFDMPFSLSKEEHNLLLKMIDPHKADPTERKQKLEKK